MELNLPAKLLKALEREATDARRTLHAHIVRKLENITPLIEYMKPELVKGNLPLLVDFLGRVPGVNVLSYEATPDAFW